MAGSQVTLLPSTTKAGATTTDIPVVAVAHIERIRAAVFMLNVTAIGNVVTDTLDVYLQSAVDGNVGAPPSWDDFVHFTQILGNQAPPQKVLASWLEGFSPTTAMRSPKHGSIAAGVQQGPVGDAWNIYVVTAGTGSFTFSIVATLIR